MQDYLMKNNLWHFWENNGSSSNTLKKIHKVHLLRRLILRHKYPNQLSWNSTYSTCSFCRFQLSPFIQAAHRAGYRVKVTDSLGWMKSVAGVDASHEPRWIPVTCRRQTMTKRVQRNINKSTKHVWFVRFKDKGRKEQEGSWWTDCIC